MTRITPFPGHTPDEPDPRIVNEFVLALKRCQRTTDGGNDFVNCMHAYHAFRTRKVEPAVEHEHEFAGDMIGGEVE